jgi:hypothetical protein
MAFGEKGLDLADLVEGPVRGHEHMFVHGSDATYGGWLGLTPSGQ